MTGLTRFFRGSNTAQVSAGGLLETALARHGAHFSVSPRGDETNHIRLDVHSFVGVFRLKPDEPGPEPMKPTSCDWTVTGKGVVIARFTFHKLNWTQHVENMLLLHCERVMHTLSECS